MSKTQRTNTRRSRATKRASDDATFTIANYAREHNFDPKRVRARLRRNRDKLPNVVANAKTLWTFYERDRALIDALFS